MRESPQSGMHRLLGWLCALLLACATLTGAAAAQIHGIPPLATSIPNHVYPYLPNAPASVTSLGPYGYGYARPSNVPYGPHGHGFRNRPGYNGYGYGYGYGIGTAVPYYLYPSYDPGYDPGTSGPYMYSGPPTGPSAPSEQTLHIIIEQAPARAAIPTDEMTQESPAPVLPEKQREPQPGVPTILVFHDGRQQEVNNYAIMGQTIYVFDKRTQKIALADLDVPATVKINDDQGVEFKVPVAQSRSHSKSPAVPRQSAPAPDDSVPNKVAAILP